MQRGDVVKDRYVIDRELGRGGIGVVYLAHDRVLHNRPVVVKVLLGATGDTAWVLRKFQQEIAALARIDHPGVVGALDVGELPDKTPFIVMQYVEGATLRSIAARGGLTFERIGRVMRQIGQALSAAHERGVIHRDLKPENVMIHTAGDDEEYARLIDFGIASVREPADVGSPQTATIVAGTVYYMAPEQLEGHPVAASDTYAMGVMAYELITGHVPYEPETAFQLLDLQRKGPTRLPSELNASIPRAAETAILKAIAFAAGDRFARARDFGDELARALGAGDPHSESAQPPAGATVAFADAGATERVPGGSTAAVTVDPARAATTVDPARAATTVDRSNETEGPSRVAGFAVILFLIAGGMALWFFVIRPNLPDTNVPPVTNAPPENRNVAPAVQTEFTYSMLVQRYRDGRPYQDPFVLPGETYFERDDHVRLVVRSAQRGHLYIVNEEKRDDGAQPSINTFFPSPTANGGVSLIEPGRDVSIPEKSWITFDQSVGTENLWLIWSLEPLPQFEALMRLANPTDKGAIRDAAEMGAVAGFLRERSSAKPAVARDEQSHTTTVRGNDRIVVQLLPLAHR